MPRHSIPNSQKAALREQRRLHPTATQKQLGHWFFETFGHRPTQSTISAILSSNYRHLDAGMTAHISNAKRRRSAKWPDLEAALIHWITLSRGTIPISQEVIREKARFFWNQLPEYEGMEMPIFSNGWLAGFQARGSVRSRSNLGEDGSTPAAAAEAMIPIRQALEAYDPKDIFNCDETALYWKRIPDRSLTTEALPGQMQRKAKISALFCCNADGSEKLHPWFIGTAQKPRAVVAAGVNISNLNFRWKSNTKSCMVTKFFEWLRWFDQKMVNRKVVLLMDNFSAWEYDVSAETIRNCFKKALRSEDQPETVQQPLIDEISAGLSTLRLRMFDPMSLENFLDPLDEIVQDDLETMDSIVLCQFQKEIDDDVDIEIPETPLIGMKEALRALETLSLYEQQQEEGDTQCIADLYRHKTLIEARIMGAEKQRDIEFFVG
ncbi:jerky [Penicillium sp. DV-2018c]|nr:jerky [Penicillium sp. DV-2018c]